MESRTPLPINALESTETSTPIAGTDGQIFGHVSCFECDQMGHINYASNCSSKHQTGVQNLTIGSSLGFSHKLTPPQPWTYAAMPGCLPPIYRALYQAMEQFGSTLLRMQKFVSEQGT